MVSPACSSFADLISEKLSVVADFGSYSFLLSYQVLSIIFLTALSIFSSTDSTAVRLILPSVKLCLVLRPSKPNQPTVNDIANLMAAADAKPLSPSEKIVTIVERIYVLCL